MKLNRTDPFWDRQSMNEINKNWDTIENNYNSVVEKVSDEAFDKIIDVSKLNWKDPVDYVENLPSNASEGDTRMVRYNGVVYRYDGSAWKDIQEIDVGPVNEVDSRLSSQLAQTMKFKNQTLFVDVLKDMQSFKSMYFYREAGDKYNLLLENGDKYIKYQFMKDVNDDFIKLNHGKVGVVSIPIDADSAQNLTGNWNTSSTNHYTTEVGATFTTNTRGTRLEFMHYAEDRGGVWEFIIDGNENNPIEVSTFSHVPTSKKRSLIIDGLADVEHTVLATFKGADPKNPPRGGTARGWAYVTTPGASENTVNGFGEKNYVEEGEALAEASNKEMAFRVGQGETTYWIPDHGTGTAFNASPPKFIIDGSDTDVTALGLNQNVECDSFELVQDIFGKTPDTQNILRIQITAKIDKSGVVDFIGTLRIIEGFWITAGFPAMMPTSSLFDEFITGIGNVKSNNGDDSEDYFAEEKDRVYSVCAVSSTNKDLFSSIQVDAPAKTLRQGKEGKPAEGQSLYLWKRANTPKIYFRSYYGHTVEVGEDYSWRTRFLIGKITDIYGFVKS